jgi:hypothetical protein
VLALAGCGGEGDEDKLPTRAPSLGPTRQHRPPSLGERAARGAQIAGLRCSAREQPRFGIHLELFAGKRVVLVPPGIGIAPPRTREGAYVRGGRCTYPLLTREPTGVVEVAGEGRTLGDLFAVWGQPLGTRRMAGSKGPVSAFVGGRRWPGNPREIPLRPHAQIVLQVGGYVKPHATYHFPPGL